MGWRHARALPAARGIRRRRDAELVEDRAVIRRAPGVRRSTRVLVFAAVVCLVALALVALPIGAALAEDPAPTTTSTPPEETTTTTTPPEETTTTTTPPEETTTTTTPPEEETTTTPPPEEETTTTVPTDPDPATTDFTPDETLVPQPAFIYLSDYQRGLLFDLQNANDTLATRRFALVGLAHQLAAAKDQLKAARLAENAAVKREIFGLLGAALSRVDSTTQVVTAVDASATKQLAQAITQPQADDSLPDVRVAEVDALARRLATERKSAHRTRVQAEAGVATLNALVAGQSKLISDAKATSSDAESAATTALGSDTVLHPQADAITAALASAQAGQTAPVLIAGFALPIPGAPLGSPFGIRIDPIGGGGGFHPGLDFDASYGTPIQAAAAGVVIMAGDCGGYGYCVVIDHGSQLATVYGHQSQLVAEVGEHVDAGQVIGYVGSTGMSTGPHLHFEVRLDGLPIDPVPTLTG